MSSSERDLRILRHILGYCEQIKDAINHHRLTGSVISTRNRSPSTKI